MPLYEPSKQHKPHEPHASSAPAAGQPLPWLEPGQAFPPPASAWDAGDPVPGLLAAGGTLDAPTLLAAYRQGIFPWFSRGQPVLWWSPDPRMVLQTRNFRLHRSLRKTVQRFRDDQHCEIRIDTAFSRVVAACASTNRTGQDGTWIVPAIARAYGDLHRDGAAHSVETWIGDELVGGLYCVGLGRMVFGESMFAHRTDASKIALAALVAFCRASRIALIDCQQNTGHLASLGAAEISRDAFALHLASQVGSSPPVWQFDPLYWQQILAM